MNLINELQVSAEQDEVLTVLRKTKRLASKLHRNDISAWLGAEQCGYAPKQPIPDYRMIPTSLAYKTLGYIPAGYGMMMSGTEDLPSTGLAFPIPLPDSLSTILSWIEDEAGGTGVFFPIPTGSDYLNVVRSRFHIDPFVEGRITFLLRLEGAKLKAIPEQIKDKVLDWALALERAGVTGEGMTFSPKEKELAHSVTFNLNGCQIGQLSNSGINQHGN